MTPDEIARMQAGLDPRAYYQNIQQQAAAGTIPAEVLQGRGATTIAPKGPSIPAAQRAKQFAGSTLQGMMSSMNQIGGGLAGVPTGRLGLAGGIIPGVTTALSELGEGRSVGAGGALLGAGVGGVLGAGAARFIPSTGRYGLIGKAAQVALPFLGAQVGAGQGAQAAEYGRQTVTKIPTKGKEGDFASQLAAQQAMGELGATQYRNNLGVQIGALRDLNKYQSDLQYYDLQRNMPLINQMKNADLIRQQSLLASQGQQLGNLSVLGTAGQLATGGQSETGATIRTMLTANPYANAVLR
jgi:hypothetical protein